jgi:fused signal recognition particle receptor
MAKISLADSIRKLFGLHPGIDQSFFDDLTDSLIEGDIGAKTAFEIVEALEGDCRARKITESDKILEALVARLSVFVKEASFTPERGKVSVYLMLGVNGVGKTTTAAKMALWYRDRGVDPVILAAADTFRAAAIEQLQYHGEKLGVKVVAHSHGADPGAVVFDAAVSARAHGGGLVIADTAGRLHNKDNLVRELQKIDRIASAKADVGCYRKFLVLDATTGQNGLRQAEVFHEAVGVDAIVLTKYDSTARGGIAIAAGKELGLPVAFVGTGERYADFSAFVSASYLAEFSGGKA